MNNTVLQLQKNDNNSVLNNNNVIFDEIIEMVGNVNYDDTTGVITISENGIYIIDWCVSTQATIGSSSVIFKLISDKGDEFDSNSPSKMSNMSGVAVFNIDNAPVNFSIVNVSGSDAFFPNIVITKANLRIFNLNNSISNNSSCFALDQFANLLEQIVTLYQGSSVSIFSNRLATITGNIDSLYISPDSGTIPLLILQISGVPVALNIDKITVMYFPSSVYDDSITYLEPPVPFIQNCVTDLVKNMYDYVAVGDNISITTGPTTSASGDISVNEYGLFVFADDTSMMIATTPNISTVVINEETDNVNSKNKTKIVITDN